MSDFSALVVAAAGCTTERLHASLNALSFSCDDANDAQHARAYLSEREPSLILICLGPSHGGVRLACDAARNTSCAVLLLVKDKTEECAEAESLGVQVLTAPVSREKLDCALSSSLCICRRIAFLRQENKVLQRKMQEIQLVGKAKALLMQTLNMTEAQAHRFIEKQAMDDRQTRAEIALRILRTYENN